MVEIVALAERLHPEELCVIIQDYHVVCAEVIAHFAGYLAQIREDGLLVYFGYPRAQDDAAQGAVRTALGMVASVQNLRERFLTEYGVQVGVKLGIHSGLAMMAEVHSATRTEYLALGATPALAVELPQRMAPDTVVISAATQQLVQGYFVVQDLGLQQLPGNTTPLHLYRVLQEKHRCRRNTR